MLYHVLTGRIGPGEELGMARRFESRFVGRDNAGLRARIREVVSGHACGSENARAVRALAGVVGLTASGTATLAEVAEDYAALAASGLGYRPSCDCDSCYAVNLDWAKGRAR